MSDELRGFRIVNETGGVADSRVEIDGRDLTNALVEVSYRHRVGRLPEVELEYAAVEITEASGRAVVRVLVSGVEFSQADVDALRAANDDIVRLGWERDGRPLAPQLENLAIRLASLLP